MVESTVSKTAPSVQSSPFQFHDHQVRTRLEGDQMWFVAKDVCVALGIDWSGKTLSSIPAGWQGMGKLPTPSGIQQVRTINEPAVYKLAFRSNKPAADEFTNWVASEVLPSIRKTGRYSVEPAQLLPYQVIRTLPKAAKDRLNDLVNTKLAHVLTPLGNSGKVKFPNYRRRSRRLCAAPQREKSGLFCFCHQNTSKGVGYILAEQRPGVRETPAAFDKPGNVVLPFFVSNPSIIEVSYV